MVGSSCQVVHFYCQFCDKIVIIGLIKSRPSQLIHLIGHLLSPQIHDIFGDRIGVRRAGDDLNNKRLTLWHFYLRGIQTGFKIWLPLSDFFYLEIPFVFNINNKHIIQIFESTPTHILLCFIFEFMAECPSINKNSKLYQKFMEKKAKKEQQQSQGSDSGRRTRFHSQFQPAKVGMSTQGSPSEVLSKQEDWPNVSISQFQLRKEQVINDLLKRQLQNDRNSNVTIHEKLKEGSQAQGSNLVHSDFSGQKSNLIIQNKKLRQRIDQQIQKSRQVQSKLDQAIVKIQELEQALRQSNSLKRSYEENINHEEAHSNPQLMRQFEKLREENHLAKDYLYKLTLRLYNSEQDNQKCKQQIQRLRQISNQSSLDSTEHSSTGQLPGKILRQRQFSNKREDYKLLPSKADSLANSPEAQQPKSMHTRIAEIKEELEELNASKVLNGKNRRRKIDLERELQQLCQL